MIFIFANLGLDVLYKQGKESWIDIEMEHIG